jgi:hypothetical protein
MIEARAQESIAKSVNRIALRLQASALKIDAYLELMLTGLGRRRRVEKVNCENL